MFEETSLCLRFFHPVPSNHIRLCFLFVNDSWRQTATWNDNFSIENTMRTKSYACFTRILALSCWLYELCGFVIRLLPNMSWWKWRYEISLFFILINIINHLDNEIVLIVFWPTSLVSLVMYFCLFFFSVGNVKILHCLILQLSKIIYLFSRNMHDASLSISIQTTCSRLMLNLVSMNVATSKYCYSDFQSYKFYEIQFFKVF